MNKKEVLETLEKVLVDGHEFYMSELINELQAQFPNSDAITFQRKTTENRHVRGNV